MLLQKFQVPPSAKHTNKQDRIQQSQLRQSRGRAHREKLRDTGLFSLKAGMRMGGGRGELFAIFIYLKVSYGEDKARIFLKMHS